jgi:hypothetical protein
MQPALFMDGFSQDERVNRTIVHFFHTSPSPPAPRFNSFPSHPALNSRSQIVSVVGTAATDAGSKTGPPPVTVRIQHSISTCWLARCTHKPAKNQMVNGTCERPRVSHRDRCWPNKLVHTTLNTPVLVERFLVRTTRLRRAGSRSGL